MAALTTPAVSVSAVETVAVTKFPVVAVAQDQGRVAWITTPRLPTEPADATTYWVTVRHLRSGAATSDLVGVATTLETPLLAVGGGRAFYSEFQCGNACYNNLYTISPSGRRSWWVTSLSTSPGAPPDGAGSTNEVIAADGSTLVYAQINWMYSVPGCDPWTTSCGPSSSSPGPVWRVGPAGPIQIPGATADVLLAAGQGRVATALGGQVQIRDAVTGGLIASFAPSGTIRALALDGGLAAVLVQSSGVKRIERYDAATGAFLASTPVPANTAAELDVSGQKLVFRSGNEIRLLAHPTGNVRLLLTAKTRPIGLSIEGTQVAWVKRVVWGVNRGGKGFVRSLRVS